MRNKLHKHCIRSASFALITIIAVVTSFNTRAHLYTKTQSNTKTPSTNSLQAPCWINHLDFNTNNNMIGIAKTFSASHLPPIHFAKLNAVNNWLLANGKQPASTSINLEKKDSYDVAGKTLYFIDQYQTKQAIYSLVSDADSKPTDSLDEALSCEIAHCDINNCQPEWLCNTNTLFSVSELTTHPNEQLVMVIKNAQELASSLAQSKATGQVELLEIKNRYEQGVHIQQTFNIENTVDHLTPVSIKHMCFHKKRLITEVEFNHSLILKDHDWLSDPNYGQTLGVISQAHGMAATGRLSDLIKIAVHRGLFELAKAKNIHITDEIEYKVSNTSGHYSLVKISQQHTESVISAVIADMKMEFNTKLQPQIYIWLLEKKVQYE